MSELDLARRVLERVLAASPGADAEVSVDRSSAALTRFANSVIHQNVAEDVLRISLRVHVDGRTASGASPDDRAARVRAFVDAAGGLETAGYCRTHHWRGGFANSAGQSLAAEGADVGLAGIARRDGADGSARLASRRLVDIDGAALGARAAAKANAAVDPIELPPDRYEVVLEPSAVADLLEALSYYGFNAKAVAEQRSFVRVGDAQFDSAIMLADDAPA